jgi:pimeloyl-ACP methyl ester carboxylesterase
MGTKGLVDSPWLLLPGTLCTTAVFDEMLDILGVPHSRRLHVPLDRPSIEDYRAPLAAVTTKTIVCGFSLGAIVAAHHAGKMTARSLILFGLNPYADVPAKVQSRHDLADDVKAHGGAAALRKRTLDVHGLMPEKTREKIYAMADASENQIEAQTQLALTRSGALPVLAKTHLPVLSLTGSQDTSAPAAQGMAAAQAAPNGHFRLLDGLGHFALLEDPETCAATLIQMMDTHHDIV